MISLLVYKNVLILWSIFVLYIQLLQHWRCFLFFFKHESMVISYIFQFFELMTSRLLYIATSAFWITCSQGLRIHLFAISTIIDVEVPSYIRCLSLNAMLG